MWNTSNGYKAYRYGFNGQDKVSPCFGEGNHTTAQFWEYDTRLGRRWNLDPVDQIGISNYAVNRLNPIVLSDRLGNDPIETIKNGHKVGMPGSGTDADLDEVEIKAKDPRSYGDRIVGKLATPIIAFGNAMQHWGDKKWRVSNKEWDGGKSWDGDRMWEQKGKPLAIATVKFHLAWSTAGMGGYAIRGGTFFKNLAGRVTWAGIGFGADGVADAASEGAYSGKAAVRYTFGKSGVMVYNGIVVTTDIMSLTFGIKPMLEGGNILNFPANSVIATDDIATSISDSEKDCY